MILRRRDHLAGRRLRAVLGHQPHLELPRLPDHADARAGDRGVAVGGGRDDIDASGEAVELDLALGVGRLLLALAAGLDQRDLDPGDRAALGVQDRKSTRLNSSHLVISYAVFCLKEKISYNSTTSH